MSQPKQILAVTDLSAPARHATERAALVSKETGASLEVFHVANLAPLERLRQLMGVSPSEMEQQVLDTARQRLQDLVASLGHRFGVQAAMRVVSGTLLSELARQSNALADGLLVCGARGESVVRHFVLGTTALRVLNTTRCPVLVVKQPPHEPYQKVLLPIDFSSSSLRAIRHARSLAPRAELFLLHAFEAPFEGQLRYASVDEDIIHQYQVVAKQEALQKLYALQEAAGLSPKHSRLVVRHGDPTSQIIEQEQELDCDLIVMGKHGENAIQELLLGSVTKRVLAESQGDMLVSV